jgi:hypothetical protein
MTLVQKLKQWSITLLGGDVTRITTRACTESTTLTADDAGGRVTVDSGAPEATIQVPLNVFEDGQQVLLQTLGSGGVIVTAESGVTIRSAGGLTYLDGQYAIATLICDGNNNFTLAGRLTD